MAGIWRKLLIVAGGFWLAFWLVLRINAEHLWLADIVVYHAALTFMLILSVGAAIRWFSSSRSGPLES